MGQFTMLQLMDLDIPTDRLLFRLVLNYACCFKTKIVLVYHQSQSSLIIMLIIPSRREKPNFTSLSQQVTVGDGSLFGIPLQTNLPCATQILLPFTQQ